MLAFHAVFRVHTVVAQITSQQLQDPITKDVGARPANLGVARMVPRKRQVATSKAAKLFVENCQKIVLSPKNAGSVSSLTGFGIMTPISISVL